jgi:hypothetical protein
MHYSNKLQPLAEVGAELALKGHRLLKRIFEEIDHELAETCFIVIATKFYS